jgi:hypothetical protein
VEKDSNLKISDNGQEYRKVVFAMARKDHMMNLTANNTKIMIAELHPVKVKLTSVFGEHKNFA